mmetsp:Transcript_4346/g.7404  ORF Transcript_4346/g.7404 Transcript_4346/m.7404 type:complete len:256 (+) Transcript_4346:640-1407(+)
MRDSGGRCWNDPPVRDVRRASVAAAATRDVRIHAGVREGGSNQPAESHRKDRLQHSALSRQRNCQETELSRIIQRQVGAAALGQYGRLPVELDLRGGTRRGGAQDPEGPKASAAEHDQRDAAPAGGGRNCVPRRHAPVRSRLKPPPPRARTLGGGNPRIAQQVRPEGGRVHRVIAKHAVPIVFHPPEDSTRPEPPACDGAATSVTPGLSHCLLLVSLQGRAAPTALPPTRQVGEGDGHDSRSRRQGHHSCGRVPN